MFVNSHANKQNCLIAYCILKDNYPNFEVGLKCILMVFP